MAILMTVHVLGVLLWAGGLYAAASVMIARRKAGGESEALKLLEKSFLFKACHPGMLLALLSGAGMLALNPGYFLQEGWFKVKLLLAGAFVALTVLVTAQRRDPSEKISLLRGLAAAGVLLILVLVFLNPF